MRNYWLDDHGKNEEYWQDICINREHIRSWIRFIRQGREPREFYSDWWHETTGLCQRVIDENNKHYGSYEIMARKKKQDSFFDELKKSSGVKMLEDIGSSQYFIDTGNLALNYICSGRFVGGGIPVVRSLKYTARLRVENHYWA